MNRKSNLMRDNEVPFNLERVLTSIQEAVQEIKEELGGKASRPELENLRRTVEDVRIHGSGQAQQALSDLTVMRAQIVKLEMEQASKAAVDTISRQVAEQGRSSRYFWIGLMVTGMGVVAAFLTAFLTCIGAIAVHFMK